MFCDHPFCDSPFASFVAIVGNGEIFYFDLYLEQSASITLNIRTQKAFILYVNQQDLFELVLSKDY